MNSSEPKQPIPCSRCGKDMFIRAGAVYTCDDPLCPHWRIGFMPDNIVDQKID